MRTHYENLKVPETAPLDAVKASYRKLCLQHHPDRNLGSPNAQRVMQIINDAYEVLSDPVKRGEYDQELALQRAQSPKRDLDPKSPQAWTRYHESHRDQARAPQPYPFYPGSCVRAEGRSSRTKAPMDEERPRFFDRMAVRVVVYTAALAVMAMWVLVLLRSTPAGPHLDSYTLLTATENLEKDLNNSGVGRLLWLLVRAVVSLTSIILICRDRQNKRGL